MPYHLALMSIMTFTTHSAFFTPTLIVLLAFIIDALVGDPKWLYRKIPHPVEILGNSISRLEKLFHKLDISHRRRFWEGVLVSGLIVGGAILTGYFTALILNHLSIFMILMAILASSLIAWRGLLDHVRDVAQGLDRSLEDGRTAVSHIVGRDPETLDESGVSRAAVESLAENFSDGTVAPIFWFALLGLPGLCAYKAINTLDSMIGHRNDRFEYFGKFAARIDDIVNFLPARITGFLIVVAACILPTGNGRAAFRAMLEDGRRHRSINAGWPEAAMAGALNIALAGPRQYDGEQVADHWMNAKGRRNIGPQHIYKALRIYRLAGALLAMILGGVAIAIDYFI
ncbi:adenosylcobinamide-phosphate synthase CbiB [Sneathiella marina]|uniref:Cobalamin biosynthesis protein CobD n=1 Tax=Sneathiella marina TaxID=2950108 RepID=A0ABY4W853_9PROT|nr:adenosylcobinamide-phosphate synthase CbiB [Sneathiella marina]USG62303.1 adenosylcobinamide-phosphate synthase CbiB [Sneathiella marina]